MCCEERTVDLMAAGETLTQSGAAEGRPARPDQV